MPRNAALAAAFSLLLSCVSLLADAPYKRIFMQMRHGDGRLVDAVLVTAGPEDEPLSPLELLHKLFGNKFSGRFGGQVYRFDPKSQSWKQVMSRMMIESKDLKISELQDGDVLILHAPQP